MRLHSPVLFFAPMETGPKSKNYGTSLVVNAIGLEALNLRL